VMVGTDRIAELFGGIGALPTTLLIDRSGQVASDISASSGSAIMKPKFSS